MTPSSSFSDEALNDLSDYFTGAPIGLNITGPDGTITRANLAELRMLGYDADEYVGRHLAEFHADPDAVQMLLDRLVSGQPVVEHETTLVRRDGKPQKVLLYANAKMENGRFGGVRCFTFPHPDDLRPDIAEAGALSDLSVDQRGVELSPEQRRELHDELTDFFENAPVNLHIVGGDGLVKRASRSEIAAMGYDADAYIGQHIARFHADPKVIDGMLEDLVGGTPLINFSATLFHRSGEKMPVMIYSNSRMQGGSFVNTRCFTVPVPKVRPAAARPETFSWPRNEDFGFTIPGRDKPAGPANPMTLALKYIASRKRPEESLGFLARVSEVLSTTRPLRNMLGDTVALTVPFLADFTSIDLDSGHAAHASTPALQDRAGELVARIDPMRTEPVTAFEGSAAFAGLGVRSCLATPITVRGEHRGVLTLLREDVPSRRSFGAADLALAQELARRIAFAVEIDSLVAHA